MVSLIFKRLMEPLASKSFDVVSNWKKLGRCMLITWSVNCDPLSGVAHLAFQVKSVRSFYLFCVIFPTCLPLALCLIVILCNDFYEMCKTCFVFVLAEM